MRTLYIVYFAHKVKNKKWSILCVNHYVLRDASSRKIRAEVETMCALRFLKVMSEQKSIFRTIKLK